ncbi:MAG: flavin reductase family protein [Lachnospiraceae bacterium]|nr:flavin reductase family protein [Lachnospiraceae bacterium]
MRKNFGVKTYVYPQPVFIIGSYDENGVPNAMNAAWGGISESNEISICVSENHKTTENILKKKAFTVSMADAAHVVECDYVGIVSGNDTPDKLEKAGLHTKKAEFVDAPIIEELPLTIECKLKSYEEETCRLVGEIINVSADERILDAEGKIDPAKLQPIVYDPVNHAYLKLGEKVGNAFSDGKQIM